MSAHPWNKRYMFATNGRIKVHFMLKDENINEWMNLVSMTDDGKTPQV